MSALADVLGELPCRICEFLFLKLPCCMERVRKSRELELYCINLKHTQSLDLFVRFSLAVPPQNVALILKLIAIH